MHVVLYIFVLLHSWAQKLALLIRNVSFLQSLVKKDNHFQHLILEAVQTVIDNDMFLYKTVCMYVYLYLFTCVCHYVSICMQCWCTCVEATGTITLYISIYWLPYLISLQLLHLFLQLDCFFFLLYVNAPKSTNALVWGVFTHTFFLFAGTWKTKFIIALLADTIWIFLTVWATPVFLTHSLNPILSLSVFLHQHISEAFQPL